MAEVLGSNPNGSTVLHYFVKLRSYQPNLTLNLSPKSILSFFRTTRHKAECPSDRRRIIKKLLLEGD